MANDIVDDGKLKVQGNLTYTDTTNNLVITGRVTVAFATSDVCAIDDCNIKVDSKDAGGINLYNTTDPITQEVKRVINMSGVPMEYINIVGKATSEFIAAIKPYFESKKTV